VQALRTASGSSPTVLPVSLWRRALTREWRRFALAAALVVLVCTAFLLWQLFRFGGDKATLALDDIGEGVAAGVAAISLALAAMRAKGRMRLAWALLGAGAASWCIGEAIWSWYEVFQGVSVPFPSAADAGFLVEIPLAIAGVLALTTAPSRLATRGEAVLAGADVALALLFIAWALGLRTVYEQSQQSQQATFIGLAYPIGDIVTITVIIIALRRATRAQIGRMLLLIGGLTAIAIADSTFTYLTANGSYGAIGSILDIGWVIGFLLIALAPLWPTPGAEPETEEGAITLWQGAH